MIQKNLSKILKTVLLALIMTSLLFTCCGPEDENKPVNNSSETQKNEESDPITKPDIKEPDKNESDSKEPDKSEENSENSGGIELPFIPA